MREGELCSSRAQPGNQRTNKLLEKSEVKTPSIGTHPQVLLQTREIEANGFLIKVSVALDLEPRVAEDWSVVSPRRNGKVDSLGMGVVSCEERAANTECTSSRDRLGRGDTAILNGCRVCAIGEFSGKLGEFGETSDGEVFLVGFGRGNEFLGLDACEHWHERRVQRHVERHTLRTLGRTYGLPFSSRYAPTPRLIFRESLSALKASVTPGFKF